MTSVSCDCRRIRNLAFWLTPPCSVLMWVGVLSAPLLAQASPWENAVTVLETSFTGTIARGLSLVAIVVGGLMMAFGDGAGKRALAGIVFGIGMAVSAVNFLGWLFP